METAALTTEFYRKLGVRYSRTCDCPSNHLNCQTAKQWIKNQLGVWQFNYEGRDIRNKKIHPATFHISLAKKGNTTLSPLRGRFLIRLRAVEPPHWRHKTSIEMLSDFTFKRHILSYAGSARQFHLLQQSPTTSGGQRDTTNTYSCVALDCQPNPDFRTVCKAPKLQEGGYIKAPPKK